MKTALITGITGQDGSYLAEFLLEKGYDVHGTIRRSSVDFRERIAHLEGTPHFHLHYADLGDSMSVLGVIGKVRPDEIYNKAGISDIKSGRKKLSVEMLRRLKLSYPSVNIDYIIMGEGEPFISDKPVVQQGETSMFLDRIAEQAEEIGRLKARIEELERRRGDSASDAQTSSIASVG